MHAVLEMEPRAETLSLKERFERRAYELYLERGGQPGSALDDWLQNTQTGCFHPSSPSFSVTALSRMSLN